MKVQEIINLLEKNFPITDACQWDNTGWQIKAKNSDLLVTNILVALDISNQVVETAIKNKANLIICHHPFFFDIQIDDLKEDNWKYYIYQKLVENNINIYVMHTNFDKNINGLNMNMAKDLKFQEIQYFDNEQLAVTGSYNNEVLTSIIKNIKNYFGYEKVQVISNNLEAKINQVILSAGAGGSLVHDLADYSLIKEPNILFITGEMKWHQQVEAIDKNINVMIVGHSMEEKFIDYITVFLKSQIEIKDNIKIKKYFIKKSFFI